MSDAIYSNELESSVINRLLSSENCSYIVDTLDPDDFHGDARVVYTTIKDAYKASRPHDIISIAYMLEGKIVDPAKFLMLNYGDNMGAYDIEWAIKELKQLRTQRDLAHLLMREGQSFLDSRRHDGIIYSDAQEIADKIIAIKEKQTIVSWKTAREVAVEVGQSLRSDARKYGNIKTGFDKLDRNIGVIKGGKLVSIAGRPGQGKTSLALDLIKHWSHSGVKVGFLSLEMSREEIYYSLIAKFGKVAKDIFRNTQSINSEQWTHINEALENISEWPLVIYDKGNKNFEYLKVIIRRMVSDNAKVIIIDQLSRMELKADNTRESYSQMVDALKNLAGELDIPIFMLCQINRESDKETDKLPKVWQLKNTGTIEETSDLILLVHLPYEYTHADEDRCIAHIIIGKNRNGATAMYKMGWSEPRCAFEEY